MRKRVVIISDLHCGHRVGLTPPGWQLRPAEDAEPQRMKWVKIQTEAWKFYISEISKLGPIDLLILNGDAIDGTGHRSGGTELITTDRNKQIDMALKCIRAAKAKTVRLVRGTPYHTGEREEMENMIASLLDAKIGNHEWYNVNGVIFDVKHFISGSSIPHGRATPVLKERVWNEPWAIEQNQPLADILIRSHVHYLVAVTGMRAGKKIMAMITPALQAMGTRYGALQMSGTVQFGFVHFDVETKGTWTWEPHVVNLKSQQAKAEII